MPTSWTSSARVRSPRAPPRGDRSGKGRTCGRRRARGRSAEGDESSAAARRLEAEHKAKAEAEEAAREQLKEENPELYAKPANEPELEGDETAEDQESE